MSNLTITQGTITASEIVDAVINGAVSVLDSTEVASVGEVVTKTYSEEEVQALITRATNLEAQVIDLEKTRAASEVEAQIASIREEADLKVGEAQAALDTKVAELAAAERRYTDLVDYLEAETTRLAEVASKAERAEERISKVRALTIFTEEYVSENAERWTEMDEDVFESLVAGWTEIASRSTTSGTGEKLPNTTVMTAGRETENTGSSALARLRDLRTQGTDPRIF